MKLYHQQVFSRVLKGHVPLVAENYEFLSWLYRVRGEKKDFIDVYMPRVAADYVDIMSSGEWTQVSIEQSDTESKITIPTLKTKLKLSKPSFRLEKFPSWFRVYSDDILHVALGPEICPTLYILENEDFSQDYDNSQKRWARRSDAEFPVVYDDIMKIHYNYEETFKY